MALRQLRFARDVKGSSKGMDSAPLGVGRVRNPESQPESPSDVRFWLAISRIADALRSAWPVLLIFLCLLIAGGIDAGTLP